MIARWWDSLRKAFDYKGRRAVELAALEARIADMQQKQAVAMAAQQDTTLALVESVLKNSEALARVNAEASIEHARAFAKNAEALNAWFDLFKQNQGDGSVTIQRPEDEYRAEQAREHQRLVDEGWLPSPEQAAANDAAAASFIAGLYPPRE